MSSILFPDLSVYNRAVQIQPGTQVVIARCTLSDSYYDPSFTSFEAQAARVGAFFVGYHWLNHGNIPSQVGWVLAHMGKRPLMLDVEDTSGNTGYSGPVTVDDIGQFIDLYAARGGVVHLDYVPHWYWQDHMGSPDLAPLVQRGQHLVASDYRDPNGPWPAAYGHMNVDEWQFTSSYPYGGGLVDENKFMGTAQDFITLATGGTIVTNPIVPATTPPRDMLTVLSDLYNEEMEGHSGFVATDKSARTRLLEAIYTAVTTPTAVTLTDAQLSKVADLILAKLNLVQKPVV